jgi:hypothetical protein
MSAANTTVPQPVSQWGSPECLTFFASLQMVRPLDRAGKSASTPASSEWALNPEQPAFDVRRAFDAVVRLKLGALLVAVDAVTQAYGQLIVDHAARIKIPVL